MGCAYEAMERSRVASAGERGCHTSTTSYPRLAPCSRSTRRANRGRYPTGSVRTGLRGPDRCARRRPTLSAVGRLTRARRRRRRYGPEAGGPGRRSDKQFLCPYRPSTPGARPTPTRAPRRQGRATRRPRTSIRRRASGRAVTAGGAGVERRERVERRRAGLSRRSGSQAITPDHMLWVRLVLVPNSWFGT